MPIHFNPGFAGDSGRARVGIIISNFGRYNSQLIAENKWYETQTFALAYDNVYKNVGYGVELIGAKKAHQNFPVDNYKRAKFCIAPKIIGYRKAGQKKYLLSSAIGFTYLKTSNNATFLSTNFQNGYVFYNTSYHNSTLSWPTLSKQLNLGLLYQSNRNNIGLGIDYRWNNIEQQNTFRQVFYDYDPADTSQIGKKAKEDAINGTPIENTGKRLIKWEDIYISTYFSQRWPIRGIKHLSLTLYYAGYLILPVKGKPPINNQVYPSNDPIGSVIGLVHQYKRLLFGIQMGDEYDRFYLGYECQVARIILGINDIYTRLDKGEISSTISLNFFLDKNEK
ncbi:MAG: hypothetical protein H7329_20305 [Opitutaceae bacterium]|nr:hypothetical protein [Cytophagales bacterium]